jgi:RNA-directed DNA polymerase
LVNLMNSRNRVRTSRGELTVQEAEETAKSKCLPVIGRTGLTNPTGNGADLLMVFYGKDGRLPMNVLHSTTFHDEKHTDKDLATQWNSIHWKDVRTHVNRLQTRIAKAVKERKWHLVKRLQYLLTHSHNAKQLAVRVVTQKRGKRTPGVDGELWTTASDKMQAVSRLTDKQYSAQPLKRIFIPKPGTDTKRPLSIPTMIDRAMQALYALALQPVAETLADKRSFGFRLFRSAQDASVYAFTCLAQKNSAEWVLEGDIKGCFNNISHEWLKSNVLIDRTILAQFLKAGFVYDQKLYPTDLGTPQGGVISPLLANLTLDGIESLLAQRYPKKKVYFIRYADDFLVTAPTKEMAEEIREVIREFLAVRGLELSEKKTVITHITDGFDFLGWNFRKYRGKLLIKPSRKSIGRIIEKIRDILHRAAAWTQDELIAALNTVVVGWANYHRHIVAADTFRRLDSIVWNMLWRWAKRRHPEKGHRWIAKRYWHTDGTRNWVFKNGTIRLKQFSDTRIQRHSQVRLDANPFLDRDYLLGRMNALNSLTPESQTKLSFFSYGRPVTGL